MTGAAPPHVRFRDDALEIDSRRELPFGGEVQCFRIRALDFDAARLRLALGDCGAAVLRVRREA
jgi:hypothetical protein